MTIYDDFLAEQRETNRLLRGIAESLARRGSITYYRVPLENIRDRNVLVEIEPKGFGPKDG